MSRERAFELLSAALDSDIGPEERAELDALLEESAEARRLQAELEALERTLADAPQVDPPSGLSQQILDRLVQSERPKRDSLIDWLMSLTFGPVLRYGFSVALGALLVVAVYENQPNKGRPSDITELVGTMAPDVDAPNRRILDSFAFDKTGISSVARLERRNQSLLLDIRIDTTRPVEIAMDFSASEFEFEALAQTQSTLDAIEFSGSVLKIKGRGQRRFAVLLRSRSNTPFATVARINLDYSSDGTFLQQGTLSSAPIRN